METGEQCGDFYEHIGEDACPEMNQPWFDPHWFFGDKEAPAWQAHRTTDKGGWPLPDNSGWPDAIQDYGDYGRRSMGALDGDAAKSFSYASMARPCTGVRFGNAWTDTTASWGDGMLFDSMITMEMSYVVPFTVQPKGKLTQVNAKAHRVGAFLCGVFDSHDPASWWVSPNRDGCASFGGHFKSDAYPWFGSKATVDGNKFKPAEEWIGSKSILDGAKVNFADAVKGSVSFADGTYGADWRVWTYVGVEPAHRAPVVAWPKNSDSKDYDSDSGVKDSKDYDSDSGILRPLLSREPAPNDQMATNLIIKGSGDGPLPSALAKVLFQAGVALPGEGRMLSEAAPRQLLEAAVEGAKVVEEEWTAPGRRLQQPPAAVEDWQKKPAAVSIMKRAGEGAKVTKAKTDDAAGLLAVKPVELGKRTKLITERNFAPGTSAKFSTGFVVSGKNMKAADKKGPTTLNKEEKTDRTQIAGVAKKEERGEVRTAIDAKVEDAAKKNFVVMKREAEMTNGYRIVRAEAEKTSTGMEVVDQSRVVPKENAERVVVIGKTMKATKDGFGDKLLDTDQIDEVKKELTEEAKEILNEESKTMKKDAEKGLGKKVLPKDEIKKVEEKLAEDAKEILDDKTKKFVIDEGLKKVFAKKEGVNAFGKSFRTSAAVLEHQTIVMAGMWCKEMGMLLTAEQIHTGLLCTFPSASAYNVAVMSVKHNYAGRRQCDGKAPVRGETLTILTRGLDQLTTDWVALNAAVEHHLEVYGYTGSVHWLDVDQSEKTCGFGGEAPPGVFAPNPEWS
jgi:hypothetical protein